MLSVLPLCEGPQKIIADNSRLESRFCGSTIYVANSRDQFPVPAPSRFITTYLSAISVTVKRSGRRKISAADIKISATELKRPILGIKSGSRSAKLNISESCDELFTGFL